MRTKAWILTLAVIGLSGPVVGFEPPCASCNGGPAAGARMQPGLDAEPCAGPIGYCLAPGCCETTRHCCDNAWAGYCDHRAKAEAFWSNVGNPYRRPCRQASRAYLQCDCSSSTAVPQPTPAVPTPAPTPTPAPRPHSPPTKLGQNSAGVQSW